MALAIALCCAAGSTDSGEDAYYPLVRLETPPHVVLEVSGLLPLEGERLLVATRRGEVWTVSHALAADGTGLDYALFAEGLQEPLGLLERDGWIWFVQRGELTRMRDVDGDGRADDFETVCDSWRLGGNYHEYNFGPAIGPDGNFWMTTNRAFGEQPFGWVDWRGYALSVGADGSWTPIACGLRSPCGVAAAPWGEVFYTDNQGEWCGASKLSLLQPGEFHGHPFGIASTRRPEWTFGAVEEPTDGVLMPEFARAHPNFRLPAVWFPYDKMGRSPSGFVWDTSAGRFGPFSGQMFVGDQYDASVMRVFLERVDGVHQGACFPFRAGLDCGVVRVAWGPDGSLFTGQTSRGWGSVGRRTEGLQRIVWSGRTPFEMREMRATADGFELEFTAPVDRASALDAASWTMSSYTYELHSAYGSDEMDTAELAVTPTSVAPDGSSVRLTVSGLREGYVHELDAAGVRSSDGAPLLHAKAFYTLQRRPR